MHYFKRLSARVDCLNFTTTQMKTHTIEGDRLKCLISNLKSLLKRKYKGRPLWALVSDATGHGSTVSSEICIQCGFDPDETI